MFEDSLCVAVGDGRSAGIELSRCPTYRTNRSRPASSRNKRAPAITYRPSLNSELNWANEFPLEPNEKLHNESPCSDTFHDRTAGVTADRDPAGEQQAAVAVHVDVVHPVVARLGKGACPEVSPWSFSRNNHQSLVVPGSLPERIGGGGDNESAIRRWCNGTGEIRREAAVLLRP